MSSAPKANPLLDLLTESNLSEKIRKGLSFKDLPAFVCEPLSTSQSDLWQKPGREAGFQVVKPTAVPKRNFQDKENRIAFLHAIANIELLAIELPALCLLRFGSEDLDFIKRQFEIIAEEAYHFSLLSDRLQALGSHFGALPVHHGLWDQALKCKNELEHQVIIPCYLEARGLDVSPEFITKLEAAGDNESADVLRIILRDEIEHVRAGQVYLQKQAETHNTTADDLFKQTLTGFFGDQVKSRIPIHRENRLKAGFSEQMLDVLK